MNKAVKYARYELDKLVDKPISKDELRLKHRQIVYKMKYIIYRGPDGTPDPDDINPNGPGVYIQLCEKDQEYGEFEIYDRDVIHLVSKPCYMMFNSKLYQFLFKVRSYYLDEDSVLRLIKHRFSKFPLKHKRFTLSEVNFFDKLQTK